MQEALSWPKKKKSEEGKNANATDVDTNPNKHSVSKYYSHIFLGKKYLPTVNTQDYDK